MVPRSIRYVVFVTLAIGAIIVPISIEAEDGARPSTTTEHAKPPKQTATTGETGSTDAPASREAPSSTEETRPTEAPASRETPDASDAFAARAAEADRLLEEGSAAYYQGRLDLALDAFEQAAALNRTLGAERSLHLAYATGWIGEYHRVSGNYPEAIEAFSDAADLLKSGGDTATTSSYIGNIGWVYMTQGEHEEALPFLEEALVLSRENGIGQSVSIWASHLAESYGIIGDVETAVRYNREALTFAQNNEMAYQTYIVSNNLANQLLELDHLDAARRYYSDALALARGFQRPDFASAQLASLAAVFRRQARLHDAYDHVDRSIAQAEAAKRLVAAGSIRDLSSSDADTAIAERCYLAGEIAREMNRYEAAIAFYSRSLSIRERQEQVNEIGVAHNAIGEAHIAWGFYEEARRSFSIALEHAIDPANEATFRNNLGTAYHYLGDLERALVLYREAIAIDRSLGNTRDVAIERNNIGDLYQKWGRFNSAREEYQAALDQAEKHGWLEDVVTYRSNLGELYFAWGDTETAERLITSARDLAHEIGDETAAAQNNGLLGMVYYEQGRLDDGIAAVERALTHARLIGQREDEAIALGNLGVIYEELTDFDRAEELYRAALAIAEERGLHHIAISFHNNIGHLARERGDNAAALAGYDHAIALADRLGFDGDRSELLTNRAAILYEMERYDEAETVLKEAIAELEALREGASGAIRRDYLDTQIHVYEWLTAVHYATGALYKAADTVEASRSAYFLEQLRGRPETNGSAQRAFDTPHPSPAIVSTARYTDELPANTVIVSYAMTGWPEPIRFVFDDRQVQAAELNKRAFVSAVEGEYEREIQRFTRRGVDEGFRFAPRAVRSDEVELLEGPTTFQSRRWAERFETIILYYRSLLGRPILRGREAAAREYIARELYTLLFDETERVIRSVETITVIPDGILGLVPFETLVLPDGRYLVEEYTIRYIHSLTVDDALRRRHAERAHQQPGGSAGPTASVLALGGAIYNRETYDREMYDRAGQQQRDAGDSGGLRVAGAGVAAGVAAVAEAAGPVIDSTAGGIGAAAPGIDSAATVALTTRGAYEELGYAEWSNLPGSLAEVEAIAGIVPRTRVITGVDASEETIRALSADGELAEYNTIHLAVHGVVVPEDPDLSAVVLTVPTGENSPPESDGYLTAGEISRLQIAARFVNLSACETALGKIYGGEGIVGLTQSFMTAGASGVGASLWKISDDATFAFMTAVYTTMTRRGLSPATAITETKRAFIVDDRYSAPFFWAPFVYYGEAE